MFQKKALFVGMESGAVEIFTVLNKEDQTSKEDMNTGKIFFIVQDYKIRDHFLKKVLMRLTNWRR